MKKLTYRSVLLFITLLTLAGCKESPDLQPELTGIWTRTIGTGPDAIEGRLKFNPDATFDFSVEGDPLRKISPQGLAAWDLSPDGESIVGLRVDPVTRALDLATIEVASGAIAVIGNLGKRPVTPDLFGYRDTLRAFRVSPEGTRGLLSYLQPEADIWIIENIDSSP